MSQDLWEQIHYSEGRMDSECSMGILLPKFTLDMQNRIVGEEVVNLSLSPISPTIESIQDFPNPSAIFR